MEDYVKNILNIYNLATDLEKAEGLVWYADVNAICQRIASKYNQPLEIVCYVMACLSPNNRWQRNIIDTETVVQMFASGVLEKLVWAYRENGEKDALRGIASTYTSNLIKAFDILRTHDTDYIGKGLKTNNFAKNIWHLDDDNVTIDYHAISIATNFRYTIETVQGSKFKSKSYNELVEAYREAGKQLGILGKQVQAITWVAWRNLDKRNVTN